MALKLDFSTPNVVGSSATLKPVVKSTNTPVPNRATATPTVKPTGGGSTAPAAKTTSGSTNGTGGTPAQTNNTGSGFNIDDEAARRRSEAEAMQAARESQIRSNIDASYQPIFEELDRQMSLIPGQKADLETQVGNLATQQQADVAATKDASIKELTGLQGDEETRAKGTLRDLEENVRNILQGAAQYLGARGAADSSATGAASEAIVQSAQKSRGNVLNTKNQALTELDRKKTAVSDLAVNQNRKIEDFKTNKLFEIAQFATDQLNKLNGQKATAKGEQARAIAQLIENTQQNFVSQLQQLDSDVFNYKKSVALWEQQRTADLEDYGKKLSLAGQYSSTTPQAYKIVTDSFGRTFAVNPTNPTDSQQLFGAPGGTSATAEKPKGLFESLFGGGQDTFEPTQNVGSNLNFGSVQ